MRQTLLGLFIFLALGLLGYFTLFLSDFSPFGEVTEMTVQFPHADNLRSGDTVLVVGMRSGRVKSMAFDPDAPDDKRITVVLLLDQPVDLREDYQIEIVDSTLLGGHNVAIEPGTRDLPAIEYRDGQALRGTVAPDMFEALADIGTMFSDSEGGLGMAIDDLQKMIAELDEGGAAGNLNSVLENFASASEVINGLTAKIDAGEGTVGAVFKNRELFDNWNSAGSRLDATLADVREGDGLVASLIGDSELKDSVKSTVDSIGSGFDSFDRLTGSAEQGTGVLGMLINDPDVATDFKGSITNIRTVSGQLAEGRGALGRFITEDEIYENVRAVTERLTVGDGTLAKLLNSSTLYDNADSIAASFKTVATRLEEGRGTIGRLLTDEEVYDRLDLALRTLTRSLEDYREAAPITTFTSVLFSGF